jgi:hypothetical protein
MAGLVIIGVSWEFVCPRALVTGAGSSEKNKGKDRGKL